MKFDRDTKIHDILKKSTVDLIYGHPPTYTNMIRSRDEQKWFWSPSIYRRKNKDGNYVNPPVIPFPETFKAPLKFKYPSVFYAAFDDHNWNDFDKSHKFKNQYWVYILGAFGTKQNNEVHWTEKENVELVPLYIGMTSQLKTRLSTHRREKPWWDRVDFIWTIPCNHKQEAERYETYCINQFSPVFNHKHNDTRRKEKRKPPVMLVNDISPLELTSFNGDKWRQYYE